MMSWTIYYLRRALASMTREPMLTGATVLTLAVVFLSFCAFLTLALAVGRVAERWSDDFHLSVFLTEGLADEEAQTITSTLSELPQVTRATLVTARQMQERLVAGMGGDEALASLEAALFPTTVELHLNPAVRNPAAMTILADRIGALAVVDQVETYGDLFARLQVLSVVARAVSIVLGIIVLVATLLVVSNTIRLSLLRSREEIEIMKLCGATDRFVKAPFVVAGALQGMCGAAAALALLALASGVLNHAIGSVLPPFWGTNLTGIPLVMGFVIVVGGALLGLVGSHWSVQQVLQEAP
jgi:cell division transport system permease protein